MELEHGRHTWHDFAHHAHAVVACGRGRDLVAPGAERDAAAHADRAHSLHRDLDRHSEGRRDLESPHCVSTLLRRPEPRGRGRRISQRPRARYEVPSGPVGGDHPWQELHGIGLEVRREAHRPTQPYVGHRVSSVLDQGLSEELDTEGPRSARRPG